MLKVSVIIAIYNVEAYIERCLHSLFNQTLEDIEYIFVNDGCTDDSIRILENVVSQYPYKQLQIKIINHSKNLGVSAARISGLKVSIGEYIIHCDPDDYVELNMYEKMYARAKEGDFDFVACQHDRIYKYKTEKRSVIYERTPLLCLQLNHKNKQNYSVLWDKLVKRELIEKFNIYPCEGSIINEDLSCIARILYHAKSYSVINEILYHYCYNSNSLMSFALDKNKLESKIKVINFLEEYFKDKGLETYCKWLKFNAKIQSRHLFEGRENEWYELFKECHKDIMKFRENPFKVRMLWFIALSDYNIYKFLKNLLKF